MERDRIDIIASKICANVVDVLKRIERVIHNSDLANDLKEKVKAYIHTKNNDVDLTNSESALLYRNVNLDDVEQLSKKKILDIDWSNHAKYRSELRDINPQHVNEYVTDKLKSKTQNPDSKKVIFKDRGDNMVVNYDMRKNPADADIITVYK